MTYRNVLFLMLILFNIVGIHLIKTEDDIEVTNYSDEEEIDLSLEDDNTNNNNHQTQSDEKTTQQQSHTSSSSSHKTQQSFDDNDEFDDPVLLHKQLHPQNNNDNFKHHQQPPTPSSINNKPQYDYANDVININTTFTSKILHYISLYQDHFFICLLVIHLLNVIRGKSKNKSIVSTFVSSNQSFFEENYAHIGFSQEYNPKKPNYILAKSYNSYTFFSSGRIHVKSLCIDFTLKKRQDIITLFSSLFYFSTKDRICFTFNISLQNDLPVVFCISKKYLIKSFKKTYSEVDEFTEQVNVPFISNDSNLMILSENYNFVKDLFNNTNISNLFNPLQHYIETILFTDCNNDTSDKCKLIINYDLSYGIRNSNRKEIFIKMNTLAHVLVDVLASSSVKSTYKKDADNRRKELSKRRLREIAEKQEKEERNQKRKYQS